MLVYVEIIIRFTCLFSILGLFFCIFVFSTVRSKYMVGIKFIGEDRIGGSNPNIRYFIENSITLIL